MKRILKALRGSVSWVASVGIESLQGLLGQLSLKVASGDVEKIKRVLLYVERACELVLDTVLMVRKVLADNKVTLDEAEAVARMVQHRIQDLDELKSLASKQE